MNEYGIALTELDDVNDADCVIVSVAHEEFMALSLNKSRTCIESVSTKKKSL